MFHLLKFWQLQKHSASYLENVADYSTCRGAQAKHFYTSKKFKLQLLIGLLFLKAIHLSFICLRPLSEFVRLINFDVTLFWSAPQVINFLNTTMCFEIINVLYQSYWFYLQNDNSKQSSSLEQNLFFPPLNLVRQVLIFGRDNTFLCRKWSSQGKTLTLVVFQKYQAVYLFFYQLVTVFIFIVLFHYEYCVVGYLVKHWRLFFANGFSGVIYLFVLNINQLGVLLEMNIGTAVNGFVGQLMSAFTTIALIRLKQAKNLLRRIDRNNFNLNLPLSPVLLHTFTQYHSQTVVLIFGSNKLFGGFILGFIASQLPINGYYSLLIVMGRFNAMATFIITTIVSIQLIVIVGLHALAALFSSAIKSFSGRLYHWSCLEGQKNGKGVKYGSSQQSLKSAWLMATYIEKFATEKRYGITYGTISLGVISFASFSKFILLYGELLMYWYRFINDIK